MTSRLLRWISLLCDVLIAAPAGAEDVIRMLVPGFVVEELPVALPNINNLRFSPQGQLTALGYNGQVYLLSDTDRDGMEDAAVAYWDRNTMSVPVGMAWSKEGLYVSSHGKVSLLKDTDGDLRADEEQVVAQGWPPTDVGSGGVDATAVTLDGDGNLYFGLLCADYSNPYRVENGVSRYDQHSLRGTIVRLAKGKTELETISTGVRVPYTLAFNRLGDLFLTDQEGATWLPGGNPLDELNHIQLGKHYGFPFRHPEYLPDVNDEPPVVGFGPQHQSTCGLIFNETRDGQPAFGPPDWEGNSLVAGFSRGRLWRVNLVKLPRGYVGKPTQVASSSMLLADMAISPRGDLYVCCHSGPPDWGTGPQGEGKLFRIRFVGDKLPQPIIAWPAGPMEARVAFDRPAPEHWNDKLDEATLAFGAHVRAADRFEVLKPPYEVVEQQAKMHRGQLPIAARRWSPDRRTLILTTDPHPVRESYAVSIPLPNKSGDENPVPLDMDYRLTGVQATWLSDEHGATPQLLWLPHLDPELVREFTKGSGDHDAFLAGLSHSGTLTLETTLDLGTAATVTILTSSRSLDLSDAGKSWTSHLTSTSADELSATIEMPNGAQSLRIVARLTGREPFELRTSYHTSQDPTERSLRLDHLFVPWAPPPMPAPTEIATNWNLRIDGDVAHGEQLFFGQQAKCANCHSVRGRGAKFAPDLGNLAHRDQQSVLRDIREPSAAINPDFVSYSVSMTDGRVLSGIVRAEGIDQLRVLDLEAKETLLARQEIEEIAPNATSAMPKGLLDALGETDVKDLLAFLLNAPPVKSPEGHEFPRRSLEEVSRVLEALPPNSEQAATPLAVTLIAGSQDHGPGEHDYPSWQANWQKFLGAAEGVTVDTANDWPSAEQWDRADVMVCYFWNHAWSAERLAQLDAFLARGGGVVALHAAVISDDQPEALAERFGLAAQPVRTKYRHGPLDLKFVADAKHPLTVGFDNTSFVDETYWPMIGDRNRVTVLATTIEEGAEQPMIWTHEVGKGRVFASILGHYSVTLEDPLFRILVLRGLAWAGHQPEGRFQGLIQAPTTQE